MVFCVCLCRLKTSVLACRHYLETYLPAKWIEWKIQCCGRSLSKLKFSVILLVLSKVESLLKVNILDWCFIKECFRNLCPKAGACGISDIKDNVRKTLQWHTQTWTLKTNLWCWLNLIKLGTCKYIVLKIKMETDRPVQTLIIKWFPFTLSLSLSLSLSGIQ